MAASTWAQVLAGALGGMFQGMGQQRDAETARTRQAALDAETAAQRGFTNSLALLQARDQYGLVDPASAARDASQAGSVATTAPQLGDPMMTGMALVQGLARKRQLDTAPRVDLPDPMQPGGARAFVQDPTQSRFAREEGARAAERRAVLDDQQTARREMATAQQQAAREARAESIAAAAERAAADRASREGIAREGNATRGSIAAAMQANRLPPRGQAVPATMVKASSENAALLSKIDQAIAAIDQHPDGLGPVNRIPGSGIVRQFTDPEGSDVRALVAGVGGQQYHDLSGAAVSLNEDRRLAPFIPRTDDRPDVVRRKLRLLKQNIAKVQGTIDSYYSDANGFRPLPGVGAATSPSPAGAGSVGDVMAKYGLTPKRTP